MCCTGKSQSISSTFSVSQKTLSHANCEDITVGLLTTYETLLSCAINNNLYTLINATESEVAQTKVITSNWIAEKLIDPLTCKFHDQLPIVQNIVNKIVVFGRC